VSLSRAWRSLDRSTVTGAPERYGVYEVGTADGASLGYGVGVLADDLRELLAYGTIPNPTDADGDPTQVRWIEAQSRAHAERLADERF
jgi:hypothetical protein